MARKFLYHAACPIASCGSSDAVAVYDTGTATCFSCGVYFPFWTVDPAITTRLEEPHPRYNKLIPVKTIAIPARGLTKDTCEFYEYGIGRLFCKMLQVAQYYWEGQLVAQHLRTRNKKFSWIGETEQLELFGQHLFLGGGKRIYVTEGEIDCQTVYQVLQKLWPVVSVPSGAQSARKYCDMNINFLNTFKEIIWCFDMDGAGQAATEKCNNLFEPGRCKSVMLPLKDPNRMLLANRADELINSLLNL